MSGDTTEKEEADEALHSSDVVRIWVGFDDAIDGGKEKDDERLTFDESFLGFGLRVHMYLKKKIVKNHVSIFYCLGTPAINAYVEFSAH